MRTRGHTIRGHEMVGPVVDLERVKGWAKKTFSRERIAQAAVTTATLVVLGYVGAVLYQVGQSY